MLGQYSTREEGSIFYKGNPRICHKLQKTACINRDDKPLIIYTNIVKSEDLDNVSLIQRNPCLFQEYIDKEYELRITALKDKVVGIAIHSQNSEKSKIDFRRYDFKNVRYEKVEFPDNVNDFCLNLLEHYKLSFGEIDMIFTPQGEYVFLELNPNGQWLWLEHYSGYPLTKDVAENFLK